MRFSKDLSQVFLRDKSYIKRIVDSLEIADRDVLEIGAGRGEVSRYLREKAKHLFCVELDGRLAMVLRDRFSSYDNVTIINDDILKVNMGVFGKELLVFGNVPYHISNQLIRHLVCYRRCIKTVYLTFQKEFAKKICAKPNDKPYSFMSCSRSFFQL